jgi:hypothetical protein
MVAIQLSSAAWQAAASASEPWACSSATVAIGHPSAQPLVASC